MITLKTLSEATRQQVFDQVVTHLLTQNEQSYGNGICLYRGPFGLKCAAGSLIDDSEYQNSMEENCWQELVDMKVVPPHHADLIAELQGIHDNYDDARRWASEFGRLACKKGFALPEILVERLKLISED